MVKTTECTLMHHSWQKYMNAGERCSDGREKYSRHVFGKTNDARKKWEAFIWRDLRCSERP